MRHAFMLGFLAVHLCAASSFASIVQINFAGNVTFSMATGFANGIPAEPPFEPNPAFSVKGHLIYDTSTAAVVTAGQAEYRQHRVGGLYAEIGPNKFFANDYDVIIANDLMVPLSDPPFFNDVLTVRFQSDVNPPLGSAIKMNGADQPGGLLNISFFGLPFLFGDLSLPSSLTPDSFLFGIGLLSHVPQGTLDALFEPRITSITPEPSGEMLSACGVALMGLYYGRSSILGRLARFRHSKRTR